jgi:hypothetical protein
MGLVARGIWIISFLGAEGYGAAVELNFNYDSTGKIIKDVQKLIDPKNGCGFRCWPWKARSAVSGESDRVQKRRTGVSTPHEPCAFGGQ